MAAAVCSVAVAAMGRGCGAHAKVSPTALTPAALATAPFAPWHQPAPTTADSLGRHLPLRHGQWWPVGLCASRQAHVAAAVGKALA